MTDIAAATAQYLGNTVRTVMFGDAVVTKIHALGADLQTPRNEPLTVSLRYLATLPMQARRIA
jgi:hypothetical protein